MYRKKWLNDKLNEGIDFDPSTMLVSYNPSHEENVDTSFENNPSVDDSIVPNIKVWSIFKRKRGNRGDGNPLVYALKGEMGWRFKSEKDKEEILKRFEEITEKFVKEVKTDITILAPSSNLLNQTIANMIASKSNNTKVFIDIICKLTTQEVDDIVIRLGSTFREHYLSDFNIAYKKLCRYLEQMDDERNGTFTRHFIKDNEMRRVLDRTMKLSKDINAQDANRINGRNVLIVDDTISQGHTVREICRIIQECYAPKSITVLTLLSKLT